MGVPWIAGGHKAFPSVRSPVSALVCGGSSPAAAGWVAAVCACVPRCEAAPADKPASGPDIGPSCSWLGWALDAASDRSVACVGEIMQQASAAGLAPCKRAAPCRVTCKQQQSMSACGKGFIQLCGVELTGLGFESAAC